MLTGKQIEIIECFLQSDGYVRAEYLSKVLDISTRTVKRYIDAMNEELRTKQVEIVSIRGTGYKLRGSKEEIQKLLRENGRQDNSEERIRQMLLCMIEAETITADELAVQLNYSASTINKLTTEIKEILKKYGLCLLSRPYYGMSIEGAELNIRSLLIDYGFYTKNNKLYVELPNISLEEFRLMDCILLEHLKQKDIIIADRDIHSLLERIAVAVSRCKKGRFVENMPKQQKKQNFDVVREIVSQVAEKTGVKLTTEEYHYVSIFSGFMIYNYKSGGMQVKEDIQEFLFPLLEEISMLSGIDFTGQEHIVHALSTHLHLLLTRMNQHVKIKNPLLQQIKSEYAMEMNYAIFLAKKMEETFDISISEDELGYLAMYFGAARKQNSDRKRAVVLCHYGLGTAQLVGEQIRRELPELEIVGIYPIHYLELAEAQDIDIIISTVKIEPYTGSKQLIVVDNLLANDALAKVKDALYEKGEASGLFTLFRQKAWFRFEAASSREAIEKLGKRMEEETFIDSKITKGVLEREEISSTDIGNLVAIPHTIFTQEYPSVIGVGILKKPIKWDKERVQLIFMICFNKKDKAGASSFRSLYQTVKSMSTVNHLIESADFHEFMAWMKGDRK